MPQDKLLNIKEVAVYLNMSEDTVKELVSKGDIPAYKIGGLLLRFKKEQIDQYRSRMAAGDKHTGAPAPYANRLERHLNPAVKDQKSRAERRAMQQQSEAAAYTFLERLEDFLYYNDFYILSLILLVLVVFAIFEF